MSSPVTVENIDEIAVVTIDNPPVNALGHAVRSGLVEAIQFSQSSSDVKAIVIAGGGEQFIGGADIREFGKPPQAPFLGDVCNQIENCAKPVIASIQGFALGGGLEVALAAHYRIAQKSARLGLPECNLGILPGAGGTQRTPRIIGARAALDLMLTGRHASAQEMFELGLIDEVSTSDNPEEAGVAMARDILKQGLGPRRSRDRAEGTTDREAYFSAIAEARKAHEKKSKGLLAPFNIIACVEAALELPFEEGLQKERALFQECMASPQREGLIHAFFSERKASKLPKEISVEPTEIREVGVVGGGTMGAGIAVSALDAGFSVTMIERDAESLQRGRANVEKVYDYKVSKGRMSAAEKASILNDQFNGSTDYSVLNSADLIIEAVFEDMDVKKSVFAELDRIAKPGAILATNTSYLDVNEIAASISRPEDVIGLHFFSPANIMKLLEVVVADRTSPRVISTSFQLAKRIKKIAVRSGVCDGFIGNRILSVYRQAADYMMEDGASPYEIDEAVRGFGYPMGPYQVTDLAGGDIGWATRKRKAATRDPKARYVHIGDRICEQGWFGQKTGRGYYRYKKGSRAGLPDADVEAIIDACRKEAGITPRKFTADEIMRRYMAAMINEGANVLAENIAQRPSDIDVALLYGYGFPRWRGGPMKYADSIGLDKILADINEFAKEDEIFWRPSPLLVELVAKGANFDSLNNA